MLKPNIEWIYVQRMRILFWVDMQVSELLQTYAAEIKTLVQHMTQLAMNS